MSTESILGHQVPCLSCTLRPQCLARDLEASEAVKLGSILRRSARVGANEHVFWQADSMDIVYAVRSGCVKTYSTDALGNERVRGFYFPGDLIGLDSLHQRRYTSSAQALSPTVLCALPAQQLRTLSETTPTLGHRILDMVSRELADALMMTGDYTAEQRVAAFLLRIGRHSPDRDHFDLDMSRRDIANCLRLVTETVSRVLTRFRDDGLILVARRTIVLCDRERLSRMAEPIVQVDTDISGDQNEAAA